MEKRIREALDQIKIPEERKEEMFTQLLNTQDSRKQRVHRNYPAGKGMLAAAAVLLALILFREPIRTMARQLLFPASDAVTGENGIQSVNIGEIGVTELEKPENMKPVYNQVLEMKKETAEELAMKLESQLLGSQKQYNTIQAMEKELGISFLHSKILEEDPFAASLCIYDQKALSLSVVDAKFSYGEEKTSIYMEIIMELEDSSKEYRYGMNWASDYQGIYRRKDGLLEAMLLQDNQYTELNWQMLADDEDTVLTFTHPFRYYAPLNTYEAVFYYDGMRYSIYGAESPEMLKDILDSLEP